MEPVVKETLRNITQNLNQLDEVLQGYREELKRINLLKKPLEQEKKQLQERLIQIMEDHDLDELIQGDYKFRKVSRKSKTKNLPISVTQDLIQKYVSSPVEVDNVLAEIQLHQIKPEKKTLRKVSTQRALEL